MLKRLYANNYRCLVNFEINFDELTLLVGPNGGGKSTLFDLLYKIRHLIVDNVKVGEVFSPEDITAWVNKSEQSFELDVQGEDGLFSYKLVISHNPDYRITYANQDSGNLLNAYADSSHGQGSFDSPRFSIFFWELYCRTLGWEYQQSSPSRTTEFDGCSFLFRWEDGRGELWEFMQSKKKQGYTIGKWRAGVNLWGSKGILVRQIGDLPVTMYIGHAFDDDTAAIVPKDQDIVPAIWCYCSSSAFNDSVRKIDQKRNVTNSTLAKVPFKFDYWTKVAEEKYPNGLPKPYSDDPTQWIFHGHPCGSVVWHEEKKSTAIGHLRADSTVLQVAVARLLGYRWPAEIDPEIEIADESRAWVKKSQELLPFADEDGIVCIPPVRGEMKAEDRLENLLAAAYGSEWSSSKKAELLTQASHAGKTLETWLRDKFFTQHCKLFHHRPFIWHIWDGLRDGFAALVNYHKLDAKLLETLIYTYLGDWISRQKQTSQRNTPDRACDRRGKA